MISNHIFTKTGDDNMKESVEITNCSDDEKITKEPELEMLDDSEDIFKSIRKRYLSRVHGASDSPVNNTSIVDQAFFRLNSVPEPKSDFKNILNDTLTCVVEDVTLDETNDDDSNRSNLGSSSDNNEDLQSRILAEVVLPPFGNDVLKRQDAVDGCQEKNSPRDAVDISNSDDSSEETNDIKNKVKFVSKSKSCDIIKARDRTMFSTSPSGMYNGKPKSFSLENLHKIDEFKEILIEATSIEFCNLNCNYSEMSLYTEGSDSVFLSPVKKQYDKVDDIFSGSIVPINTDRRDSIIRSETPVNNVIRTPSLLKLDLDINLPVVKAETMLPMAYPEDIKPCPLKHSIEPVEEIPDTISTVENVKDFKKWIDQKLTLKSAFTKIIGSNKNGSNKDRRSSSPTIKSKDTEPNIASSNKYVRVDKNMNTIENNEPQKVFSRFYVGRHSFPSKLPKDKQSEAPKIGTGSEIHLVNIETQQRNPAKRIGFNRRGQSSAIQFKENQSANGLNNKIIPNSVNDVSVLGVTEKPLLRSFGKEPEERKPEITNQFHTIFTSMEAVNENVHKRASSNLNHNETTYLLDDEIITADSPNHHKETLETNAGITDEVKDEKVLEAAPEWSDNLITTAPPNTKDNDSETLMSVDIDTSQVHRLLRPTLEVSNVKNTKRNLESEESKKSTEDSTNLVDVNISKYTEKSDEDNINNPKLSEMTRAYESKNNLKVSSDDTISKCSSATTNPFLYTNDFPTQSTKPVATEAPFDVSYHLKINTVNDLVSQDVALSKPNDQIIATTSKTQERLKNFLPIQTGNYLNKMDRIPSPIIISPVLIQPIFLKQTTTSLDSERKPDNKKVKIYYDDINEVKSSENRSPKVSESPKVDESTKGQYLKNVKGKNLQFLSWKAFDSNESPDSKISPSRISPRPAETPKRKVLKLSKTPEFLIDNHYYQPMENVPFVISTTQSFTKPKLLQTRVKEVKPTVPSTNPFLQVNQPRRDSEENYYEEIGEPLPILQKPGNNIDDDEKISTKFQSTRDDFSAVTREEILKVPRRPRRPKKEEKHVPKIEVEDATDVVKEMASITKSVISLSRSPAAKDAEKKYSGPVGAIVYNLEKNSPQERSRKLSLQGQKAPQTDVNTGSLPRDRKPYWKTQEHKRLSHPIRSLNDPPPPRPLRKLPMDV